MTDKPKNTEEAVIKMAEFGTLTDEQVWLSVFNSLIIADTSGLVRVAACADEGLELFRKRFPHDR